MCIFQAACLCPYKCSTFAAISSIKLKMSICETMERWKNRIAVVTGASAGIGAATVKKLLSADLIVVGLAKHKERMDQMRDQLSADQVKRFYPIQCDVSSPASVQQAFNWIIRELRGVDILVNGEGIFSTGQLVTMDIAELQRILHVNVLGVIYCTQRAYQSMKERNVDGHVVIVNSDLARNTPPSATGPLIFNLCGLSKYTLQAVTEMYRQEFASLGTRIKITSVSPSLTDTDMVPEQFRAAAAMLKAMDVANCILYAIATPPNVQVQELVVNPL